MAFDIILDDVAITHLTFGKEYTAAVEAKQVAQQDAEVRTSERTLLVQRPLSWCKFLIPASILFSYVGPVQRAKFIVVKAQQEKERAILQAQGEAQSAKLIGEAIQQNPAFLTLRKIEAAREVSERETSTGRHVVKCLSAQRLHLYI
jgi:prohibitin 2